MGRVQHARLLVGAGAALAGCGGCARWQGEGTRGARPAHCCRVRRHLRAELVRRTHIRDVRRAPRRGLERARCARHARPTVGPRVPRVARAVGGQPGALRCSRVRRTPDAAAGARARLIFTRRARHARAPVGPRPAGGTFTVFYRHAPRHRHRVRRAQRARRGPHLDLAEGQRLTTGDDEIHIPSGNWLITNDT
jgi:hypothetical protein